MNPWRVKTYRLLLVLILLGAPILGLGCANKAKLIQAGAAQFEAESLLAIEKIDELRRKETEATLPPAQASEFFVESIKKSTRPITRETLRVLLDPLKPGKLESEAQWQAFLQKMRLQYTTFAATFATLDKGSWFAAPQVKKAIPILDKLIAQMAAFARAIEKNPAEFIRERAGIAAEIEQVREVRPYTEATDLKLLDLERRLREVAAAEQQMTKDTTEQALKAATLGTELRQLLINYDKMSLDDLAEGLAIAFKLAAEIPGLDISGLKARTDELVGTIQSDESLSNLFNTALAEIHRARAKSS